MPHPNTGLKNPFKLWHDSTYAMKMGGIAGIMLASPFAVYASLAFGHSAWEWGSRAAGPTGAIIAAIAAFLVAVGVASLTFGFAGIVVAELMTRPFRNHRGTEK